MYATQASRPGSLARVSWRFWRGFGLEGTYTHTTTQLWVPNYAIYNNCNHWQMTRLSLDPTYTRRIYRGFSIRGGMGAMVTLSGAAQDGIPVGADQRLEEMAGVTFSRGRMVFGYTAHAFRNPDFSDHTWHPSRNIVSEISMGFVLQRAR